MNSATSSRVRSFKIAIHGHSITTRQTSDTRETPFEVIQNYSLPTTSLALRRRLEMNRKIQIPNISYLCQIICVENTKNPIN